MKRPFIWHRQAYIPRLWPSVLIAIALATPLSVLAAVSLEGILGVLMVFVITLAIGNGVLRVRFWLWERRHPVLPDEALDEIWVRDQRKAAPWN